MLFNANHHSKILRETDGEVSSVSLRATYPNIRIHSDVLQRTTSYLPYEMTVPVFVTCYQPTIDNYAKYIKFGDIPLDRPSVSYHKYFWKEVVEPSLANRHILHLFLNTVGNPDLRREADSRCIIDSLNRFNRVYNNTLDLVERNKIENITSFIPTRDHVLCSRAIKYAHFPLLDNYLMINSLIMCNNVEIVKMITKRVDLPIERRALSCAVNYRNLEIFKEFKKGNERFIDSIVILTVAKAGNLDVFKEVMVDLFNMMLVEVRRSREVSTNQDNSRMAAFDTLNNSIIEGLKKVRGVSTNQDDSEMVIEDRAFSVDSILEFISLIENTLNEMDLESSLVIENLSIPEIIRYQNDIKKGIADYKRWIDHRALIRIAESGNFEMFKEAIKGKEHLIDSSLLNKIVKSGNLEMFQEAVKGREHLIDADVLRSVVESGNINLFKEVKKGKEHVIDAGVLSSAVESGNLVFFNEIKKGKEHLIGTRVFISAVRSGNLDFFKEVKKGKENLIDIDLICAAAKSGNVEMFKEVIKEKEHVIDADVLRSAVESGNLEMFQEAKKGKEHLINLFVLHAAVRSGKLDLFSEALEGREHLILNGRSSWIYFAAESGNLAILCKVLELLMRFNSK